MEPEILVLAALAGILPWVVLYLVRRIRAHRRTRAAARIASQQMALDRLAWLTGRAEEPPPAPPVLAPVSAARSDAEVEEVGRGWVVSPRRRLWRDTSAILLVGVLAAFIVLTVAPPASAPEGGVLAATATPRPTAAPLPTPRPTPRPTATPSPSPTAAPSPTPTAAPTATPTAKPTPKPTKKPTAKPTPRPTPKPTAKPTPRPTPKPTAKPTPRPTPKPTPTPPIITPPPA